jgi:hypothetical protein
VFIGQNSLCSSTSEKLGSERGRNPYSIARLDAPVEHARNATAHVSCWAHIKTVWRFDSTPSDSPDSGKLLTLLEAFEVAGAAGLPQLA